MLATKEILLTYIYYKLEISIPSMAIYNNGSVHGRFT